MAEFRIDDRGEPGSIPMWFERWAKVAEQQELTFVLPDGRLHSSALVVLAAMTASRRSRGLRNEASSSSAADMEGVRAVFLEYAGYRASMHQRSHEVLRAIDHLSIAHELAEETAAALTDLAPSTSPSVVRMARFVFEELGANIVQHSGRASTGFGYMRVDVKAGRFELAFADAGIGFRASLQRNPDLEGRIADDVEALQLALTPRISGTAGPRTNMGIGLKLLTDFSDLLNGDLWIASGSAMLHRKTTAGQRTNTIRSIPSWQGTWICLDAPIA